ncbi:BRO family protein [Pseudomonas sichuanensis]|uniref:BRO-N domain-containing protein n=1 Tax=Pseudomonas sichuanensis TaxID=2213015 RepID=UPI002449A532|nr:BRO family protein [Pseudomonas sichuanensis]MDH0732932.1 BRO family protein [Pseudomonas sichuanensis]MDH1581938.1 BRO family protein [Pseudomonas sichuanensis]MDH1591384.1 BRO family protein [Pseudomonas sichuanensis]MDH1597024.1 BRO family protein [Pseudomonas sichuanensis]
MHTPILLDYQADNGLSKIRTLYINENLYISLEDVVLTLAKNNSSSDFNQKSGLGSLIKAQLEVLDKDEYHHFPSGKELNSRTEVFITEPGLYRIISRDSTPASKKFQRWIFHEVIPSVRKHGTYPPPAPQSNSEIMSLAQALAQHTKLLVQEIEEREKLAAETKLRFEQTERKLIEIDQKIDAISIDISEEDLVDVDTFCHRENIEIDRSHLAAMCAKLCLEQSIYFKKKPHAITPRDHLYPETLIAEAEKIIRR